MARNAIPIVLKQGKISRAQRQSREKAEEVLRVSRLSLEPPAELSERAKLKFYQIANEAFWLDGLSCDFLAAYCHAWDRWLTLVEELNGQADVITAVSSKGMPLSKANPRRDAIRTYLSIMSEMSSKLALSAVDRLKLIAPVTDAEGRPVEIPANKFECYMSEVEKYG